MIHLPPTELYGVPKLEAEQCMAALQNAYEVMQLPESVEALKVASAPQENEVRRMHKLLQAESKLLTQAFAKYGFDKMGQGQKALGQIKCAAPQPLPRSSPPNMCDAP